MSNPKTTKGETLPEGLNQAFIDMLESIYEYVIAPKHESILTAEPEIG